VLKLTAILNAHQNCLIRNKRDENILEVFNTYNIDFNDLRLKTIWENVFIN